MRHNFQVGDWCYSSFSKVPCRIVGIREDEGGYFSVLVDKVFGWKDIASFEPVEIMDESLEKNGFSKNGSVFRWMTSEGSRFGGEEVVWNKQCKILSIRSRKGNSDIFDCKYYHEIQNELKNHEIEKEIIL